MNIKENLNKKNNLYHFKMSLFMNGGVQNVPQLYNVRIIKLLNSI